MKRPQVPTFKDGTPDVGLAGLARLLVKKAEESEATIIPMTCTEEELCAATHDNVEVRDFSIMTDTHTVWLSEQKRGHEHAQSFSISRKTFNKLIRWYTEGVIPTEDKRK